jgi:hypothetical protein
VERNIPSLEIPRNNRLIKEDKHSLLALLLRHKPAEPDAAHIIPHLDPGAHAVCALELRLGRIQDARGIPVDLDAVVVMHTHYSRVLARLAPLTQENSTQCLAEESLTLSRNGICSPPSAGAAAGFGGARGEGGTLRGGWYALGEC